MRRMPADLKEAGRAIENTLGDAYQKIEDGVVGGYKKIEDAVVNGYKKIAEGAVEGFNKMTDNLLKSFLPGKANRWRMPKSAFLGKRPGRNSKNSRRIKRGLSRKRGGL